MARPVPRAARRSELAGLLLREVVVTVTFQGMSSWAPSSEIIECSATAIGNVDLHNSCDFLGLTLAYDNPEPSLILQFRTVDRSPANERFSLSFVRARHIEIRAKQPTIAEDYRLFHAIDFVVDETDQVTFSIEMETVDVKLSSTQVNFAVLPSDEPA